MHMTQSLLIMLPLFFAQCMAEVITLTAENFDQHVDGTSNILVEFYAPWLDVTRFSARRVITTKSFVAV